MKMKSKFFGINAKLALATLAVCSTVLTSCYEKEEIDVVTPTPVPEATYFVAGTIYDVATNAAISGAITITGAEETASPGTSFKVKAKADANITVTVAKEGYYTASRTVFVGTAAAGTTNIINADIAMTSLSTEVTQPEQEDPIPAPDKEFTPTDLTDLGIPHTGDKPVKFIDGEATIFSFEAKTLPAVLENKMVSVNYDRVKDGLIITDIAVTSKARAISDVDQATRDFLGKAIASKLNTPYLGLKFITVRDVATIEQEAGKAVIGIDVNTVYNSASLDYVINGKMYKVTYMSAQQQGLSFAYDTHDSHDSHDGHDGHGGASNAGGGSGSSK